MRLHCAPSRLILTSLLLLTGLAQEARAQQLFGGSGGLLPYKDISFSPEVVDRSLDYEYIRERRRRNFLLLRDMLQGRVRMLREDLEEGVCPLFFPILVKDKHAAAQSLWQENIGAVEFWNDRQDNPAIGPDARYLRAHVLELPIHQDVTTAQVEYTAQQVLRLELEPAPC